MENTTELEGGDQNIKIETKQFQCDICQQYLKSKASLQVHVIIKHQKESHKYKGELDQDNKACGYGVAICEFNPTRCYPKG